MRSWFVVGLVVSVGCTGSDSDDAGALRDAGFRDAGTARDAGPRDGGTVRDGGPRDGGPRDGGPRDGGAPVHVQILGFNDFHGALEPPGATGGAAYLATHIEQLRTRTPHTFTVVAGDLIGGSPLLSGVFHDEPTIEVMNAIGLDFVGVGNHEFDEGTAELERMQNGGCHPTDGCFLGMDFDGAGFRFLSANVFRNGTADTLFPGYEVVDVEGVPIAFIGMTLESTPASTIASGIADLTFADEAETANAIVADLRTQGVETFVVLLHEGPPSNVCTSLGVLGEIVTNLSPAVDVVIAGHTNAVLDCAVRGIVVTSAGGNGRLLTSIDLELDRTTKDVISANAENLAVTQDVPAHAGVTKIIDRYRAALDPLAQRVVGTITADLLRATDTSGQSTLGRVITDAQLAATSSAGAVVAFQQGGGVRANLFYGASGSETGPGQVTFAEAFQVHPFGNYLITMSLTGAQIEEVLETQFAAGGTPIRASGSLSYVWDAALPVGARIDPTEILIDGTPIDLAATYRVTVNSFLAQSLRFPTFAAGLDPVGGAVDVDALAAYLEAQSPVAPPALNRISRRN